MAIFLSISPLILVVFLSLCLHRPAYLVAWCGVALAGALAFIDPLSIFDRSHLTSAVGATVVITIQAALVIGPGLYLNAWIEKTKGHIALIDWVCQIPMDPMHKRLMIVLGLAPALESLTGFGVSLLMTVPLLLTLSDRQIALRQSMLSMNIMPWGTLGLATVVGAHLSGQNVTTLGYTTSLVSLGVFPCLGMLTTYLSADSQQRKIALRDGALVGLVLAIALVLFNRLGLTELAGIFAGFVSLVFCIVVFRQNGFMTHPSWHASQPYVVLLLLIGLMRTLPYVGVPFHSLLISYGGMSFAPLASPFLPLLVTILWLTKGRGSQLLLQGVLRRASKPILALAGFTLLAQLMVTSGMVQTVYESFTLHSPMSFGLLSPMLGLLSGYLTGSNVGGNALMMTLQVSLATETKLIDILSAVQNSASGHAVFASMPIILLIIAIAGEDHSSEDSRLVRFGLNTMAMIAVIMMAACSFLIYLSLK